MIMEQIESISLQKKKKKDRKSRKEGGKVERKKRSNEVGRGLREGKGEGGKGLLLYLCL